ncbi:MAG: hypothetical protein U5K56_19295 [Halioglobus sp.]|nr:hypothetical protein [Halioglobus sp.]
MEVTKNFHKCRVLLPRSLREHESAALFQVDVHEHQIGQVGRQQLHCRRRIRRLGAHRQLVHLFDK